MKKTIVWRKNFEIKRVDYQMLYPVMEEMHEYTKAFLGRAYLTQGIWVIENMDNTGTYFPKSELRAMIEATVRMIVEHPAKVDALHARTIAINKKYFACARKIESLNHAKLSDRALLRWYRKIMELQRVSHGISLPTTWFVDSDGEDFSRYLLKNLTRHIAACRLKENPATVFSTLTTPRKDSMARIEEKELLALVAQIQKNTAAQRAFAHKDSARVKALFDSIPSAIRRRVLAHFKRWRWTPYTYLGPAYELDYYLEVISGLIRQKVNPKKLLREFQLSRQRVRAEQRMLSKKLHIDPHTRRLFKIAQDIVFIKGFRKDCLYYGSYARDMLLKEVARRLHISLIQAKYFIPNEVAPALLDGKFSTDSLNARMKFSVIYMKGGKNRKYLGAAAKKFLAAHAFEKVKIVRTKELTGMCASPGRARGMVKIVNLPEDIAKMREGDIMVSHTTFPALVPAMKKAAAIITEDGGITCHAAIVSRELKRPCIVGVGGATQALKDGQMVEVDAERGMVKKI